MKIKNIISLIILVFGIGILSFIVFMNKEDLVDFYKYNMLKEERQIVITNNEYSKKQSYNYVQLTTDFYARDYKHLLNIIYTVVNSGNKSFTFYCGKEYTNCLTDLDSIAKDQDILSNINNFVHPFNSFNSFKTYYDENGKVDLIINNVYTSSNIIDINLKVDEIINNNIQDSMSQYKKIKVIHDYLINNSKYSSDNNNYNNAYSILYYGKGVCSAYTDTMAIFLERFNINNYKISADNHIWNLVYWNNSWYHLDITFDDPVTNTGQDILLSDMFLIKTSNLLDIDDTSHHFRADIYSEAN